jgi:hypothetical protein
MPQGAAIGVLLCALVIFVAVGTLIGAVFLRAAVALYNKLAALNNLLAGGASPPSSVPEPALGKAMSITFAIAVVQFVVALLITGLFTGDRAGAAGAQGQGVDMVAQLISFPVSLLIMVEMLSARLPTTFGRAFLVTLCTMLVTLLAVGVLVGIAVLVFAVALRGAA